MSGLRLNRPAWLALVAVALTLPASAACVHAAPAEDRAPPPFLVAAAGGDDETPEQQQQRRAAAQLRWDAMTPERQEQMRKRHERFKSLSPEKRTALKTKFKRLGGSDGTRTLGRRLKTLRTESPGHMKHMRRKAASMRHLQTRLVDALPAALRDGLDKLDAKVREAVVERVAGTTVRGAMRQMTEAHATPEELALFAKRTNRKGDRAMTGMRAAVMAEHTDRLNGLERDARSEAELGIFEDAFWIAMQPLLPAAHEQITRLLKNPEKSVRESRRRRHEESFKRRFGVSAAKLGIDYAPKALTHMIRTLPSSSRGKKLKMLPRKLKAIADLPMEQREKAFADLLRRLSGEGTEGTEQPARRRERKR